MPHISKLNTVPLTEEEKEHLMIVYRTRLPYFAFVFGVFALFVIIYSFGAYKDDGGYPEDYEVFGYKLVGEELFISVLLFFLGILSVFAIRIFMRRIYAFKRDADCGRKQVLHKTITDKKHFPNTGQYFISFDDPNYMHHEVDADTYYSLREGDTVPIYRGIYSKYVFQKDARFTFM